MTIASRKERWSTFRHYANVLNDSLNQWFSGGHWSAQRNRWPPLGTTSVRHSGSSTLTFAHPDFKVADKHWPHALAKLACLKPAEKKFQNCGTFSPIALNAKTLSSSELSGWWFSLMMATHGRVRQGGRCLSANVKRKSSPTQLVLLISMAGLRIDG